LHKAIELKPDLMISYGLLARYYVSEGKPEKSLENLRQVVERNPRDVGAWMLTAQIYEQKSDWAGPARLTRSF
jgi:Tfp pilus assembly protein PilF